MSIVTHDSLQGKPPPEFTGERLLLHNVSGQDYQAIVDALKDHPALRLTFDRGNLEMRTAASPPVPTPWSSESQRLILHDVNWQAYETLLHALDQNHLRMTYDRGSLEIMTLSPQHERAKHLLGRLILILGEECDVDLEGLGSTTYRRENLERGFEADECYYLPAGWERVKGKKRIDLTRDPPPDLVVEVEITHSCTDRMSIFAQLGIQEVWRFNGSTFQVCRLGDHGVYEVVERSPLFPRLLLQEIVPFIHQGATEPGRVVARAFRAWVREQLGKP